MIFTGVTQKVFKTFCLCCSVKEILNKCTCCTCRIKEDLLNNSDNVPDRSHHGEFHTKDLVVVGVVKL